MTKKDYIKAAKIVNDMKNASGPSNAAFAAYLGAMDAMVELFKSDNPNFDETRFRQACKGK